MKLKETQVYKGIGTIEYIRTDDGDRIYYYTHFYTGQSGWNKNIKVAEKGLDREEKQAQVIKQAIEVLSRNGYKVFKEVA